ncbi:MAG: trypsin-like peptidase domain-containing protein [Armatimonadetes bacterium]|nr:trypsin-like peptidase domain-containing protein [Armatimonadota bacterium]MDE2207231.1 trypsin-like peptidase domain-containing protein [Armatimonadota bacterium]
MSVAQKYTRVARFIAPPVLIALGAVAVMALRASPTAAALNDPPVIPSQQVLGIQQNFEQVAERLRPSIVLIKSIHVLGGGGQRSRIVPGAWQGQGQNPFQFFFGNPGNGQNPFGNGPNPFGNAPGQAFPFSQSPYPQTETASGSGVIVRPDGYILTNDHVVANASSVSVQLQDGRVFPGKVYRDFQSDLALVKINADNLPAATLGDSKGVKIGQWAIAFGNPFGLSDTMTVGVISSVHRDATIGDNQSARYYPSLLQTDASINPGNSGGALVDVFGRVIGINVAIESPSGGNVGIGFAIPVNTARYVMDQLIDHGVVQRGFLGLTPVALTPSDKSLYGVQAGALVTSVEDGTPAARAGVQVQDVVTQFNGTPVNSELELRNLVARTTPGTDVSVVVVRNHNPVHLNAVVGKAPVQASNTTTPLAPTNPSTRPAALGVQVGSASDPSIRQQFKLPADIQSGAVVVSVTSGSPAELAGIQAGEVITSINGRAVSGASSVPAITRQLSPGSTVRLVVRGRFSDTGQWATMLVPVHLD